MKLFILGILLLIGFPAAMYLILGPGILENASVVIGTIGVAVVLFAMACLCTIKNVLSFFVDLLLVTVGAFLLLIAAFAKPLGLLDDPEGRAVEERIMGSREQRVPSKPDEPETTPPLDEVLDEMANDGAGKKPTEVKPDVPKPVQNPEDQPATEPVVEPAEQPENVVVPEGEGEGLERFKEESGQD